ncbi:ATP-binding cassette domain-containing protein [Paenibacillus spongiae]|uniref:ABC transporter ATP-binding protein n=1 Tax=Paenibacillus spongiae TaxID=2909671 RepID=A0ABY5S9P0_9BACL|nr:ABC transporter ATP-binding protein [Paenibacillus spongiae]UVI30641.1 ABC transporter ATP-binding protein [Paenibacillus spongiae]
MPRAVSFTDILLRTNGLTKHYPVNGGLLATAQQKVHALDKVNLTLYKREIVGVVGESGCGKSTLAKVLLRLIEPTEGTIHFDGREITGLNRKQMRDVRREMQFVDLAAGSIRAARSPWNGANRRCQSLERRRTDTPSLVIWRNKSGSE